MNDHDFRDPNGPKQPAVPVFFTEPVKLEFRSKQEGRPVFEDRDMVRIIIPGDRRSMVVEIVNDEHKARWPREYEAFKAGKEAPVDGTPLSDWPQIGRARVEELAYFHIRTVEQLAALTDNHLQNLGMGAREERERAKVFLDVAKNGTGALSKLVTRVEQAEAKAGALETALAEANARLAALEARKEKARG